MNQGASNSRIRQYVVPISETPFAGDLFERKPVAEKLTKTFGMLQDGGAVAIDGPWGSGKTWFAKNWQLDLEKTHGYSTVYIDAFAMDYVDDPFVLIAGELLGVAREKKPAMTDALLKAGAKLGKALLPVGVKVITSLATKLLVGEQAGNDIGESFSDAVDGAGSIAEKQVEKKLIEYENEKASVAGYQTILTEMAATLANPIVVFVDELDRCRPDFAIKTLERIKHFFEVPGVVFVLMINGDQLAASVRGAYGVSIDAESYLRKFILFSVRLSNTRDSAYDSNGIIYCRKVLSAYGLPDAQSARNFAEEFGALATALKLAYRDIERGCALFVIGQPIGDSASMIAWVVAIKLWRPDLFNRLLNGDQSVHGDILKVPQEQFGDSFIVKHALELHRFAFANFQGAMNEESARQLHHMLGNLHRLDRAFPWLCNKVNLSLT